MRKYERNVKEAAEPYFRQVDANAKQIGFAKILMILLFVLLVSGMVSHCTTRERLPLGTTLSIRFL